MKHRKESDFHKEGNANYNQTLKNHHIDDNQLKSINKNESILKGSMKSNKCIRNSFKSPEDLRRVNENIIVENYKTSNGFYTTRNLRNDK
jgi:hypothetical protein